MDSQITESQTETKGTESEITQQQPQISPPDAAAEFTEEDGHIPIREKPYQTPDISSVSEYFVHKKVGSGLDIDVYLELIDKETDGLYCTVKNNKNVWREVVLKAYDEYSESIHISTAESFAIAPNDEVVVKLIINAGEYNEIDNIGFSFFCSGQNYSAAEQTANIREKEEDVNLSYVLWLYRFHEASLWDSGDDSKIDLSENFIRGFNTNFFDNGSKAE